ncbi:MAG: HEAT repeat domain-containing protein [Cyanobacteria bacterium P01_G01_bin.49]
MVVKKRKIKTFSDFVFNKICELPTTITNEEEQLFNSLSLEDTVPILQSLMDESKYGVAISSRAFDALLKLKHFDQVAYLIDLYKNQPEKWKWIVAERLSKFDEPRTRKMLCEIAMTDEDADARYNAVHSLYQIGGEESIPTLEHIQLHDDGVDYEDNKIANLAKKALTRINSKKSNDT